MLRAQSPPLLKILGVYKLLWDTVGNGDCRHEIPMYPTLVTSRMETTMVNKKKNRQQNNNKRRVKYPE